MKEVLKKAIREIKNLNWSKLIGSLLLLYFFWFVLHIFNYNPIIFLLGVIVFLLYRVLPPEDARHDYYKWRKWVDKNKKE